MNTDENELNELIALMERAAKRASDVVLGSLTREGAARVVGRNPSGTPTRAVDRISEESIFAEARESRIPLLVVSEEQGIVELGKNPAYALVIDPLDGTTNALHSIPFFAVSLGLARLSESPSLSDMVAGLVRDVPRAQTYLAARGRGFTSPDPVPRMRELPGKPKPLISLYAYGERAAKKPSLAISEFSLVRTLGSVSLEMCLLAAGNIDAFVDVRNLTRIVDVAAALVILEESGCLVTSPQGKKLENALTYTGGLSLVAAKDEGLHGRLIEMVSSAN
jgi:fructose-1,6-bisphosphatase/inositol monophosphatase family enzyme